MVGSTDNSNNLQSSSKSLMKMSISCYQLDSPQTIVFNSYHYLLYISFGLSLPHTLDHIFIFIVFNSYHYLLYISFGLSLPHTLDHIFPLPWYRCTTIEPINSFFALSVNVSNSALSPVTFLIT